jgi:hypothetical protein
VTGSTSIDKRYACVVSKKSNLIGLMAASILAARKLAQYDGGKRVPATVAAIADAVRWAEETWLKLSAVTP